MKNLPTISDAELEIMDVLWKNEKPMKIQEVLNLLTNSEWKYNTVGTLLLRLNEKGAVSCEKVNRVIYYTPLIKKDEYTKVQTKNFVNKLYNGSVKELAVSLFKSEDMTDDDLVEIRKMFSL